MNFGDPADEEERGRRPVLVLREARRPRQPPDDHPPRARLMNSPRSTSKTLHAPFFCQRMRKRHRRSLPLPTMTQINANAECPALSLFDRIAAIRRPTAPAINAYLKARTVESCFGVAVVQEVGQAATLTDP